MTNASIIMVFSGLRFKPQNTLKLINCSSQKRTIKVISVEIDPTMCSDKIKRKIWKKGGEPLNSNVRYLTDRDHRVYQGRDGEKPIHRDRL